ncbi:MAG TPA: TonB-dependent receptor [Bryobacteraceae bacterium]|jgi:hypothetical protein
MILFRRICLLLAGSLWFLPAVVFGQASTLRGVVTDESGALVPGARVTVTPPRGAPQTAATDAGGAYSFSGLAPGTYSVQASGPNLALPQSRVITLDAGTLTLNLQLRVASTIQRVEVQANGDAPISTDPANSAAGLVLRGKDLDALSDDPEDLQADLQALAGPSAGPGGGSIFVDGFSGGDLPPKESIREIRINQSPFSAEYDKLGLGRIEIFTKPGSDKYRGNLNYNLGTGWWNSRNPYSAEKAPFLLQEFENSIGGPLGKRASFTLDANQNNVDNGAIVDAVTLNPQTLLSSPLFDFFKTIQRRTMLSPRVDYQLNPNLTLTVRDTETHGDIQGNGIGGFNLTSLGSHLNYNVQTAQMILTAVRGTTVNDTRFQFYRNASSNLPNDTAPSLQVLGSFTTGGSTIGAAADTSQSYEFQNATSILHGAHTWRFGVRLRGQTDDTVSPQNFNGTFTFGGGLAPVLDANNQPLLDSRGQPVLEQIDSIERYRRTLLFQGLGLAAPQIRALGGGATQFSIGAGTPEIKAGQMDAGLFLADDWRMRPNLTWSLGLRYETQTNIHDHADWAPRIGVAWAPGAKGVQQKTVLRAGFGMFYDRFALGNTLTAERYNGVTQQQYVVSDPDFFPNVPLPASLAGLETTPVTQRVSASLRAPYLMQSAFTLERMLPRNATLAVTYTNSLGRHMLRSEDLNAPLPGTYNPSVPGSGMYPMGRPGAAFLMESAGVYAQNQLIVNSTVKINAAVSLPSSYTLNRARSNTDGIGTIPANPYNFAGEYGSASTDVHQRFNLTGSINTRWNVQLSPLMNLQSGPPFDITDGNDPYGTTLFNARPGIATDPSRPGLIATPYGLLDPNPLPGDKLLPRNFGRGPGSFNVNLRIAKTIGLGPERGGPKGSGVGGIFTLPADHRYNLRISMSIRNLLNHTNPGPLVGNITSPLFGRANQVPGGLNGEGFSENANNRRLELQIRFTY